MPSPITKQIWGIGLLVALVGQAATRAETDEGVSAISPWSGPWWPHKTGGLTGPLSKYDQAANGRAALWEKKHHVEQAKSDWFGHCHAWAASSVTEREPRIARHYRGIKFGVGELKGLLAACHAQDVSNTYGDRFGDRAGSENRADLTPDHLWMLLQLYVRQQKLPLILDLEAGEQVWNYPVFQYLVDTKAAANGWTEAVLHLVAADDNVSPDFVGTQSIVHSYTFRVKLRDGAIVVGSGEWTGNSVQDHPDFAWYPFVAMSENPEVDVDVVSEILGSEIADEPFGQSGAPASTIDPQASGRTDQEGVVLEQAGNARGNQREQQVAVSHLVDETLTPYELAAAVVNTTSHFPLDLTVDRGDGGRYHVGEAVRVSVRSGEAGYLYLFDADEQGALHLIFPTPGQPNAIQANVLYALPPRGSNAMLVARETGQHNLKGIVTPRPLRISGTRQSATRRQPQAQGAGPEPIVVHPTAEQQMKQLIARSFVNDKVARPPAPRKLGRFAQDACLYFVLAPNERAGKIRFAGLFPNP
jgi:Transglutaminase elicitor/Domain of unknown function (DUF4384)